MLVTNSDKYFDLKLKDSEELILNSRLMKEVKFRKRKSSIIEKQEVLFKYKSGFVTELSEFFKYRNSDKESNIKTNKNII